MSDVWKHYEGQIVNGKYTLLRHVGGSGHSVVFLTELDEAPERKAAIKFISGDFPSIEIQFSRWQRAAQLRHRHLLGIFDTGRCRLAEMDLIYVVLERADEDLSEILSHRALTVPETKGVLDPLLEVLSYLHAEGIAHTHLKPSNIHAVAERLKLSSDTLLAFGETHIAPRAQDSFDAPESGNAPCMAANDVWSLGATLVQVLTQQLPSAPLDQPAEPIVPEELPEPYRNIVQHSLRPDPGHRWKLAEVAAALNPAAPVVASVAVVPVAPPVPAVTPVSPLSVPLSAEPAIPGAKLPTQGYRPASVTNHLPKPNAPVLLPNYVIPVLLAASLFLMAVFALPKLLRYRPSSPVTVRTAGGDKPAQTAYPHSPAAPTVPPTAAKDPSQKPLPPVTVKRAAPQPAETRVAATAPAVLHTDNFTSVVTAMPSKAVQGKGEVLDPVLPSPSAKSLATIQGTVRVLVRVKVDAAGSVMDASLDSPGVSRYFSGLAEQAARLWEFRPPEAGGRSIASEWLIRYEFTQAGARAFPSQVQR